MLEFLLALILMIWATNQMEIITNLQGGDISEGSLTHTINYNLGNNLVNCSYEDCCPQVFIANGDTSFAEYAQAPGIFSKYNESWPRAKCIHPGDECTEAEIEEGHPKCFPEELAPAPLSLFGSCSGDNCTNTTMEPSSEAESSNSGADEDGAVTVGTAPSNSESLPEDISPLLASEYNGRQQMCMLFGGIQTVENCWNLGLYDTELRKYFWSMLQPFSTVIFIV